MHNRKVGDKKRTIRRLKRQIREKIDQNRKFDEDLEDLALNVAERTQISKKTGKGKHLISLSIDLFCRNLDSSNESNFYFEISGESKDYRIFWSKFGT